MLYIPFNALLGYIWTATSEGINSDVNRYPMEVLKIKYNCKCTFIEETYGNSECFLADDNDILIACTGI